MIHRWSVLLRRSLVALAAREAVGAVLDGCAGRANVAAAVLGDGSRPAVLAVIRRVAARVTIGAGAGGAVVAALRLARRAFPFAGLARVARRTRRLRGRSSRLHVRDVR